MTHRVTHSQNTDHRLQNTEYRIQNTEDRIHIQNTECRIQNTEYSIQNTEFRIHTPRQSLVNPTQFPKNQVLIGGPAGASCPGAPAGWEMHSQLFMNKMN